MNAVKDAAEALESALQSIDGVRAYRDPGANVSPPAAVIGPPVLQWGGICSGPTSARFLVYVLVKANSRSLEDLWELVPRVAESIDDAVSDAVVTAADPGTFNAGGTDLPSYEITVEVTL